MPGKVKIIESGNQPTITLNADTVTVTAGTTGQAGSVRVLDGAGHASGVLDGNHGSLTLGRTGTDGDLVVRNRGGVPVCHIDGASAGMWLGEGVYAGHLYVRHGSGKDVVELNGTRGAVVVRDNVGSDVCTIEGAGIWVGNQAGKAGHLRLRNASGGDSIHLDGHNGDIVLANADCAEEFDVADAAGIEAGTVVVIDDDERLTVSRTAYDTRVAGVISGAGKYRPAIVLDRRAGAAARPAVAMIGKVACRVDAGHGPIRCGDLLVSSPTPGHAMAARDRARTPGAVLGKALRDHAHGTGLISILVCLQ